MKEREKERGQSDESNVLEPRKRKVPISKGWSAVFRCLGLKQQGSLWDYSENSQLLKNGIGSKLLWAGASASIKKVSVAKCGLLSKKLLERNGGQGC